MYVWLSLRVLLAVTTWIGLNGAVAEQQRFDGYQVLRVKVQSVKDREVMTQLLQSGKYDFWSFPNDVMVEADDMGDIDLTLKQNNMHYDVWIEDVQTLIDNQFSKSAEGADVHGVLLAAVEEEEPMGAHYFNYSVYHRYAEIDQWVKDTVGKYPELAEEFQIGRSYEKRVMRGVKIGNRTFSDKQVIWLHSGIHAREWISPATNIWMANQFLVEYTEGGHINSTAILNTYDIYVLPVLNPDGYEYSWDSDRLWRKTRSPNVGSECIGTDANRNWAIGFGGLGTSPNPCSIIYTGPYIHSEIEVRNVVNFITRESKTRTFVYYNDIHSYSQLHLSSWGYKYEHPKHYDEHMALGTAFADALRKVHGTNYTVGSLPDVLYEASGVAVDWGYGGAGIKHSYTLELRDEGHFGFLLPEDQIIPTAEETFAGMKASFLYVMDNP